MEQHTQDVLELDMTEIAKEVRTMLKNIPGAVFSVRVNRAWAKRKEDAKTIIHVQGAIKLWGDDYSDEKQERSNLLLQGMMKDIAEEHQLELHEFMYCARYNLVRHH